ncbi:hypothetical protein GLP40_15635 [Nocardia sp. CT2-14]|uniref:Lecithin:cholesterol acyltransferase n=2 Tax=Nocardia aurantiaca TaxID=2675850 RepID=A0A6I3L095_9NOCA|nr:hypothetical protein [Nocardia aurantiaca]
MGSTLAKHGHMVWEPSAGAVLRAIATFGHSIKDLQLPDGIGDDRPGDKDPGGGVEPVALMPDVHVLPGIWTPIKGYTALLQWLNCLGFREGNPAGPPGNLLPVPYDWRLSNRYNGKRLAGILEPALERWRAQGGPYEDAKICFVCHSMGGLVARWYIAHGGAEITRKLVTLGTPYRGAARAVDQLVRGIPQGLSQFALDLTSLARSLPSAYQLLPSYACIEQKNNTALAPAKQTKLLRLDEVQSVPELAGCRIRDAMRFYDELETVENADRNIRAMRNPLTGTRQRTGTTLTISDTTVTLLDTYRGEDLGGDATVPAVSLPRGIPLDDPTIKHYADKHGNLQCNPALLEEIDAAVSIGRVVARELPLPIVQVRVDVPELILYGEDLPVVVDLDGASDPIQVTVTDEIGHVLDRQTPKPVDGTATAHFTDLPPGAHIIDVTGTNPQWLVGPVSSVSLVWSDQELARHGLES